MGRWFWWYLGGLSLVLGVSKLIIWYMATEGMLP